MSEEKDDKKLSSAEIIEMGQMIELDNSPDVHKSFPCEFFQNKNLCDYAIVLGGYLHSLPPTWTPRRDHLKKELGWGRKKWEQACEDLRLNGYMMVEIGGKGGGARLRFSIYKNFPVIKTAKVIHKRCVPLATCAKSDMRQKSTHRYSKHNGENINIMKDHKQAGTDVLESDLGLLLKSWGWYNGQIINAINLYGSQVMYYQVGLIRESNKSKPLRNRGGALTAALKRLESKENPLRRNDHDFNDELSDK